MCRFSWNISALAKMNHWAGSELKRTASYCTPAHDFMNEMSGEKRKNCPGALKLKLLYLLKKILGRRARMDYGIREKNRSGQTWLAEQCLFHALQWLSPPFRTGLAGLPFCSCHAGRE